MAADLNVIYKISADISGLQSGVDRAAKSAESLETTAGRVGKALAGMFTITAIVGFSEQILGAADAFKKMAQQAGITTDEAQKLNYIAGQTSTSVESLVSAAQNLQQRLGDDNSGAAGAMRRLGINAEAFNQLGTYQQMTTLGSAIRDIKDPTEQASVAAAIFGKTWKEILPAIKSGMQEVGDQAPIMAASTIESLDRVDDALKRSKQQAIVWGSGIVLAIEGAGFAFGDFLSKFNPAHFGVATSTILKLQGAINDPDGLKGALANAAKEAQKLTTKGLEPLGKIAVPTTAAMKELDRELQTHVEKTKAAAEAAEKAAQKMADWKESVEDATIAMNLSVFTLHRFGAIELPNVESSLKDVETEIRTLASRDLPDLHTNLNKVGQAGMTAFKGGKHEADLFGIAIKELSGTFQQLAKLGGPSWIGGMISSVGQLTTAWITATKAIKDYGSGSDAARTATLALGTSVASVFLGVITYLAQADVKAAELERAIGKLKRSIDFAEATRSLGAYADAFIKAIANARTLEETQRAIQDLTNAIEFQKTAMQTLADTAAKYGFTLAELGPAMQRQNLDQQAQTLYKDFQVLTAGGIDAGNAVTRMADATNSYIHDALNMGIEVPAAMKPMLQRMVDMGLLTDANGNKITDLGDSGISFAESMTEGFSRVVEEVKKLTEAIIRGLGLAIDTTTKKLGEMPKTVNVDVNINERTKRTYEYDDSGLSGDPSQYQTFHTGGLVLPKGQVQHFATGGLARGSDTVPALLTPGEMVLTQAQQREWLGSDGVQVGSIAVTMLVSGDTDTTQLAEQFKDVLRRDSTVYEAVSVVARRAVA